MFQQEEHETRPPFVPSCLFNQKNLIFETIPAESTNLIHYRTHTQIEFPLLELEITLPPSVKCKDSAIRVLWLSYDHFSDYSPSNNIPLQVDTTIGI